MAPTGNHHRDHPQRDTREDWRTRMKPLGDASPADVARMILKRAGITPLLPAIGVALLPRPAHPATADDVHVAPVVQAEARVRIVSAQARIRGAALELGGAAPDTRQLPVNLVSHIERPCTQPTTPDMPDAVPPVCRLTIYDLP